MLAEKRKKTIYSNPRGTLWANDETKFGQRMLESMGWTKGKGLGKMENGIVSNVKPSFKFDSKGFGFEPPKTNQWIEDNHIYEQILNDLGKHHRKSENSDINNSDIKSNLEQKTESSNRLYYKKFIEAKNLSSKSKEDLFCVFPTMKNVSSNKKTLSKVEKFVETPSNNAEFDVVEREISVQDYFKEKMKIKKLMKNQTSSNINEKKDLESENSDQFEKPKKRRKKSKNI